MSKTTKVIIVVLVLAVCGGVGAWLLRPKTPDVFDQKEINVKPPETNAVKTLTYNDEAGFSFNYPSDLTVLPVELTDKQVYSALEITGNLSGKVYIRISDTTAADTNAWIKDFEKNNVISDVRTIRLDDLTATEFVFNAPKIRKTVAVNENILYSLENPADDGYWDRVKEMIVTSFRFMPEVYQTQAPPTETNDDITLIDESLE